MSNTAAYPQLAQRQGTAQPARSAQPTQDKAKKRADAMATWLIGVFWFQAIFLLGCHIGTLYDYVYLLLAIAVGVTLCGIDAGAFISFTWQIYFFTPLFRRLIDYEGHWDPQNPIILAPLALPIIARLITPLSKERRNSSIHMAFIILMAALGYGLMVGVEVNGFAPSLFDTLEWVVPPLFAWYMICSGVTAERLQRSLEKTFVWGMLVMGVYGIWQFVSPQPWDAAWLLNSQMFTSMGHAVPYSMRIWSTVNSTGPYATILMGGLMLAFLGKGRLRWAAMSIGAANLLLTLVRSAWGGLAIGLVIAASCSSGKLRGRLVSALLLCTPFVALAFAFAPVADVVSSRAQTFSDLSSDNSFNARMNLYIDSGMDYLMRPVGTGMGSTGIASRLQNADKLFVAFDSGVLNIPFVLGWPGTAAYVWSIYSLYLCTKTRKRIASPMRVAGLAIAGTLGTQMLFCNSLIGVSGMVFWTFLMAVIIDARTPIRETRVVSVEEEVEFDHEPQIDELLGESLDGPMLPGSENLNLET